MKIKIFITGLIALIISSCSSPRYLPTSDKIDVNEYGSHIIINRKNSSKIDGELIAIDSNKIIVLTEGYGECVIVSITDVQSFQLRYAKPKHYGWTIPVYTLSTITHGYFAYITAPISLIVTICVTSSGESSFKLSEKNITYNKLKMFARFPQGIPPNIDLRSIK
jgi:hypothetical protein